MENGSNTVSISITNASIMNPGIVGCYTLDLGSLRGIGCSLRETLNSSSGTS